MMIRTYFLITLAFFCMVIQSCENDQRNAHSVLKEAKDIVEEYPDSALFLLRSIHDPVNLDKDKYAEYVLLLVQAKDKAYKDIANDTAIFHVTKYFQEKKT